MSGLVAPPPPGGKWRTERTTNEDGDDDDEEFEVEIYEDEDGSFYYIDPDSGEEVPCDEDGNSL